MIHFALTLALAHAPSSSQDGLAAPTAVAAALAPGTLEVGGEIATKRKRPAKPIEVPVDIGVGVIGLVPNPPVFFDQPVFTGLRLNVEAVVDKELIREHRDEIPKQWRGAARNLNELRVRPWFLAFIPEMLVLSPGIFHTGMYGAVWRPLGAGLTFLDAPVRIAANAAVDLAAIFIHSDTLPQPQPGGAQTFTLFLRPGINLTLLGEVPITDSLLVAGGWSSDLFVPQPIGGAPWELFPLEDSLWHLGGPFVEVHIRIPYEIAR